MKTVKKITFSCVYISGLLLKWLYTWLRGTCVQPIRGKLSPVRLLVVTEDKKDKGNKPVAQRKEPLQDSRLQSPFRSALRSYSCSYSFSEY